MQKVNPETYLRKAISGILVIAAVLSLCSCSVRSKSSLLKYAKEVYGDCKFIKEDHGGSGNTEYRTLYLEDKETGIKYTVTSGMNGNSSAASDIIPPVSTTSDFKDKYYDYLFDEAKKDLKSLEEKYDCDISHYGESVRLIFDGDIDDNEAVKVADKIDDVFADYDVKDMRFVSYTIYSGGDEIFAYYNVKTGNYQSEKD